nr:MAG TPA: hypothetical protein [Caudoviricetes sp.]
MIIVILVLGVLMAAWGIKLELDKPIAGVAFQIIGAVVSISSIIVVVLLVGCVVDRVNIDKKISLYEEENTKIEQQIADVVNQYQEHESGIFKDVTPEGAMTLVTLYPELKSDALVQSQIDVYVENNKAIKELKSMTVNASFYRWWLYLGK